MNRRYLTFIKTTRDMMSIVSILAIYMLSYLMNSSPIFLHIIFWSGSIELRLIPRKDCWCSSGDCWQMTGEAADCGQEGQCKRVGPLILTLAFFTGGLSFLPLNKRIPWNQLSKASQKSRLVDQRHTLHPKSYSKLCFNWSILSFQHTLHWTLL